MSETTYVRLDILLSRPIFGEWVKMTGSTRRKGLFGQRRERNCLARPRCKNSSFFSIAARREAGFLLRRLQRGDKLAMPQSRPMPSIGRGCHELRIPDETKTWRLVYRVDADAIVIWEVFSKKDRKTPKAVIDACKKRIRDYDALG